MSVISEWTTTLQQIFSSAGQFYENETDTAIGGKPIKIAFISLLLSGIFSSTYSLLFGAAEVQLIGLLDILIAPIAGIIGLAVSAGLTHLVGMLLGFKNGYSETFSAFAYATVIAPVASLTSLIPIAGIFIALVLGLFSVYVQIKGVQKFQQVSFGKSAVAVLIPAFIIIGILLVLSIVAGALFAAMMGAGGAPAAPPM